MDGLEVRDARPDEQGKVLTLTLAAYEEYVPLMPYWDYYRDDIIATLRNPGLADRIVAERDGSIVGSVLLFPAGKVLSGSECDGVTLTWPEMRLLAVDPAARRQGIGATLVDECIRRARNRGAQFLTLLTNRIMSGAIGLYEHMGFEAYHDLDFTIDGQVIVKGYRFDLTREGRPEP